MLLRILRKLAVESKDECGADADASAPRAQFEDANDNCNASLLFDGQASTSKIELLAPV